MTSQVMAAMTLAGDMGSSKEPPMFLQPSSSRLFALIALYSVHTAITIRTLMDYSLMGLLQQAFINWGTGQIFSDLVFALVVVSFWLVADARERKVAAWPWILGTMIFGSLSPGLYLIVRERALLRPAATGAAAVL